MSAPPAPAAPAAPRSPAALFWACTWLALQGFGGVLAVVQQELVERRRWLTREQFLEDWAAAQLLPGPNVVNLSLMIGGRHFGWRGAVAALAGMLLAPLALLLVIAIAFTHVAAHPMAQGALRGMGAVAAGLILGTALRLLAPLRGNVLGPKACAALAASTFVAVAWVRLPLAVVLAVTGGLGWGLAARRLRRPGGGRP
ncbi:putative chromate transport protein [Tepidimonas fonticaldi]|uniref:Chromate transporter n=1 Tax=Tepidimonas fonticaldi TaxID=1101373 RepID=A0A1A6DV92_9BURK|nr:chromate transporter [Tepidimonas fonticaldi]OBS30699.1 chromate transporter [Tepidimonas fonticaldi]TSE37587.1 putative chromate transport protein [Tepidimonas fonticaldi]